jgi:small subunit ribosomal protein S3
MTHVVHPYAHRLGILRDWRARWFVRDKRQYAKYLVVDTKVREFLHKRLKGALIGEIDTEVTPAHYRIVVRTARPGVMIGRGGENINALRAELAKLLRKLKADDMPPVRLDVEEIRSPETNAAVVAQMIAEQLEKRIAFRRVLKQMADKVMASREVEGGRIILKGRVGGSEMKRKEEIRKGRVPLTTLRADVDYAHAEAYLPYIGLTGIKVWIYRGEVFDSDRAKAQEREVASRSDGTALA